MAPDEPTTRWREISLEPEATPLPPRSTPRKKDRTAPADAFDQIVALAGQGLNKIGIAKAMGVSLATFNGWLEENPELNLARQMGHEDERMFLHGQLIKLAGRGLAIASIFLLKARHGYRDSGEATEGGNKVNIIFQMPAALPLDEFKTGRPFIEGSAKLVSG